MKDSVETVSEEALTETFSNRYPHLKEKLRELSAHFASKGGFGVFAPIKGDSCGACRVRIATATLQRAQSGSFITCANCARFLYLASKVSLQKSHAPTTR